MPGPAALVATGIAGLGVALGFVFAFVIGPSKPRTGKVTRAQLLAELEDLERAHASGEIGPRTYDRARRDLIDALARTLAHSAA